MHSPPRILIAGAGFAGSLLAVQLAAKATTPLHITLCDAANAFARGVAYSTRKPFHLLNVRADRMGAFEDRHDDFYRWLLANEQEWRVRHPNLAMLEITPEAFIPRMLYGDYIASLLAHAQQARDVTIETLETEVTDAEISNNGITLILKDGKTRTADRLVLATGSLTGMHPFERTIIHDARYTRSIWSPPKDSILARERFYPADEPVLIIGTGLTMIDAYLTLRNKGYQGKIIALSRHGLLPQPHDVNAGIGPRFLIPDSAPRTALGLFYAIRNEIKRLNKTGTSWHAVIDGLRGDTPALWAVLPESERKKLLRVLSFWSVHRHRMPVSSAQAIARDIKAGTLAIRAGSIKDIAARPNSLDVQIRSSKGKSEHIEIAHAINCAGPGMDIEGASSPLLRHLATRGLIRKGPLGMGIAADADGKAAGNGAGTIFALGPLLIGERLESIAVPELRKQAEALATALIASL